MNVLLQIFAILAVVLSLPCDGYGLGLGSSRESGLAMTKESRLPTQLTLKSPCKINLFLRIMGRRPTGYRKLHSNIYLVCARF